MTVGELLEKFRIEETPVSIRENNSFRCKCYANSCPEEYLNREVDFIIGYYYSKTIEHGCFVINIEDEED